MSDEAPFLRTLLAAPADVTARLVYADWLDDRDDPRAGFLRLDADAGRLRVEGRPDPALDRRLAGLAVGLDPGWVAFVTTLGRPFREGPVSRDGFDIEPADMPFAAPVGWRGRVVTFGTDFAGPDAWQPGLLDDLRLLGGLEPATCSYGAASLDMHPFLCELAVDRSPLTGADILAGLRARHFRSQHIQTLGTTAIPYPGYHPSTDNDEVHTDFREQYLFEHDESDEGAGNHGRLKRHVDGGRLWYVLLHPTKHDGYAAYAVLLAVGRSPHGRRLVGVVTHQVCHNLGD